MMRSRWQPRRRQLWTFLCPLCRATRSLPLGPRPGQFRHFMQIGLTSIVFMLLFWGALGWKGIISFVPFWAVFETVYRLRLRSMLGCPHCGFDPYLFRVDLGRARSEIEAHWRKKFSEKGIPYPEPKPKSRVQKLEPFPPQELR